MIQFLDRPIAYHRAFVGIGCGITGAVMLSQAVYWAQRTSNRGGWFYKTQAQWEDETGLTRYEQEGARKKLKQLGVLEEMKRGVPCKVHYRINEVALTMLLSQYVENQQTSMQNNSDTVCGNSADSDAEKQQTITENTHRLPKTTTENNKRAAQAPSSDSVKAGDDHKAVFEHWQSVHGKTNAKLIKNRLSKINARLKEGYTVDQLKRAIDGCKLSPFHMGDNDNSTLYNDLKTILRDGAQVEKFISIADNPPKTTKAKTGYMQQDYKNTDWHEGVSEDGKF